MLVVIKTDALGLISLIMSSSPCTSDGRLDLPQCTHVTLTLDAYEALHEFLLCFKLQRLMNEQLYMCTSCNQLAGLKAANSYWLAELVLACASAINYHVTYMYIYIYLGV